MHCLLPAKCFDGNRIALQGGLLCVKLQVCIILFVSHLNISNSLLEKSPIKENVSIVLVNANGKMHEERKTSRTTEKIKIFPWNDLQK